MYEEFVNVSLSSAQLSDYSNVIVYHWHAMQDIPEKERFSETRKKTNLVEIASQFRHTWPQGYDRAQWFDRVP
jgi:hypothetical protein